MCESAERRKVEAARSSVMAWRRKGAAGEDCAILVGVGRGMPASGMSVGSRDRDAFDGSFTRRFGVPVRVGVSSPRLGVV